MFSGIIETTGIIRNIDHQGTNFIFQVESAISHKLKIDESISHDGVCLTVTDVQGNVHTVIAIKETLQRSNFKQKKTGDEVNLERSMKLNDRLNGHLVQGHVDATAECKKIVSQKGSWLFEFLLKNDSFRNLIVEKGSICLNGVSLTLVKTSKKKFSVAIIPYTFEHSTFHNLRKGDWVNVEFDIIGKYVQRQFSDRKKRTNFYSSTNNLNLGRYSRI
jgi:riboflavin synthase